MEKTTIGSRLRNERKRLRFTIDEMAELGGVGKSTQVRYEADQGIPDSIYLNRISVSGAEIFWIMRGTSEDDDLREKKSPEISAEEQQLLSYYKQLPTALKRDVYGLIQHMLIALSEKG